MQAGTTVQNYWFDDLMTLDGGTVPQSVVTAAGANMPPNFGGPSSIPVFADCNDLDAWPMSLPGGTYDPIPTTGNYNSGTGDKGSAKGHSLGRFVLNRHPGGVNVVFLDGRATTIPLAQLWQLRWNKNFVPVSGLAVK
jgi:prepilin-type processing-associated H-X9-DG protein